MEVGDAALGYFSACRQVSQRLPYLNQSDPGCRRDLQIEKLPVFFQIAQDLVCLHVDSFERVDQRVAHCGARSHTETGKSKRPPRGMA